jgi:hypothetical protein
VKETEHQKKEKLQTNKRKKTHQTMGMAAVWGLWDLW